MGKKIPESNIQEIDINRLRGPPFLKIIVKDAEIRPRPTKGRIDIKITQRNKGILLKNIFRSKI